MKLELTVTILLCYLIHVCSALPSCLINMDKTPSEQCLLSLNINEIISQQKQLVCPLCIIVSQKQLYGKAEQFCFYGKEYGQCSHKYFQALILNNKMTKALSQDYQLFFKNPFHHNQVLQQVLGQEKIVQALLKTEKSLLQNQNQTDEQLFSLAIVQFYLQKKQQARLSLQKYLQKTQNQISQTNSIKLMCRILQQQTKYYDGLNFINQKLKLLQQAKIVDPYIYHLKGNFLMHHLKFKEAISQFKNANKLFVNDQSYNSFPSFQLGFQITNYNLGLCHQKINQQSKAVQYYQRVVKSSISPQAEPLNALGNAYMQMYQKQSQKVDLLNKAKFYYKQSILKNQSYYLAYYNLGYLALLQKKYDDALQFFEKTLKLNSEAKSAKYGKIKAYILSSLKQQGKKLIIQMINEKKDQTTFTEIISILTELNQFQHAQNLIHQYNQLVKTAQAYEWKGMVQYSLDKFKQAKQSFETAIFKGSKSSHIYFNLAYCCELLQDYQSAIKYYAISNQLQKRQQTKKKVFQIQNIILEKASKEYGIKQTFHQQL